MVQIEKFVFSPFQENTYVLHNDDKECIIIDPGCYSSSERDQLKGFIEGKGLTPIRLINTHCHLDHIFGNAYVSKEWDLKPEYHELEQDNLDRGPISAQLYGIPGFEPSPDAENHLKQGEDLEFGGETFNILFVPGHAAGHVAFYSRKLAWLISGDVIFCESIGRTDLPGGNHQQLLETIEKKVFTLPDDTIIFNGHGPETTVKHEKAFNPFFR